MLDVSLRNVSAGALRDITLTFASNTCTAIAGTPAGGASTLLRLIAGHLRPETGEIHIGTRDVSRLSAARRPLLYVTSRIDAPSRWSVRHLLIAALRQRGLDRDDRRRELDLAVAKWHLTDLAGRPLRSLSSSERTSAHLARIELLRPAILAADRLLGEINASALGDTADEFYRTLRVIGTTVVSAPASCAELGLTDQVVVLDRGRVLQQGIYADVYQHPLSEAAAASTGEVNVIPITIRADQVQSPIGEWSIANPPFEGNGIALARPEGFQIAEAGEESDLIFGIEEASFRGGRWLATGILSGGVKLRVWLPAALAIEKGRLLPLRFDPSRFTILKLPSLFGNSLG